MFLGDLWKSCVRRWYIVVVCLVVTAGITLFAAEVVQPTYAMRASVVLVPPQTSGEPSTNRYLGLSGLEDSADVLTRSLTSDDTVRKIKAGSPRGEFVVERDLSTSAPIILVTATSHTRANVGKILREVLDTIPAKLSSLQAAVQIKPANRMISQLVSEDAKPKTVQKTRIRILGALVAVLLLGSAVLVAGVDGVLLGRAATRGREPADVDVPPDAAVGLDPGEREGVVLDDFESLAARGGNQMEATPRSSHREAK